MHRMPSKEIRTPWFRLDNQGRILRKELKNQMKSEEEHSRQREEPVQRPWGGKELGLIQKRLKERMRQEDGTKQGWRGRQVSPLQGLLAKVRIFSFYLQCHWRVILMYKMTWFMFLKDLFSDCVVKEWMREGMNQLMLVECFPFAQWHASSLSFIQ